MWLRTVLAIVGLAAILGCGALIDGVAKGLGTEIDTTWVDADFLAEHEVQPWQHMTVWVPPSEGYEGFAKVSIARAKAAGLTTRPLAETARDTLEYWKSLPEERRAEPRAGLPAEREREVLTAWHAAHKADEDAA